MQLFDVFVLIYKTLICYLFLSLILRLMGKREISQISMFDLVCFLIISELFSLSLNNLDSSIFHSIIPITIIVILQIINANLSLKSRKFRKFVEGYPTFLIYKGQIQFKTLKKNRYNLDDLLLLLRNKDCFNINEVEFALLENNGDLNIILKKENQFIDPLPIIEEGKINNITLKRINKNEDDILKIVNENNYKKISEIYIMILLKGEVIIVPYKETN